MEDWRRVLTDSRSSTTRSSGSLVLRFHDDAGDELKRLVAAERECCAFLGWDLTRDGQDWLVTIIGTDAKLATLTL